MVLTKAISSAYGVLIEIALWILLLVAGGVGFVHLGPSIQGGTGDSIAFRLLGAFLGIGAVLVAVCVFVGPLLLLLDIRRSLRRLEELNESASVRQHQIPATKHTGIPEADHWRAS